MKVAGFEYLTDGKKYGVCGFVQGECDYLKTFACNILLIETYRIMRFNIAEEQERVLFKGAKQNDLKQQAISSSSCLFKND